MCRAEGLSLQRGMNFNAGKGYSVILMSRRKNAPYNDLVIDDGTVLIYEGHDAARGAGSLDVKSIDQPGVTPSGRLTQNGKFHLAAEEFKRRKRAAERVMVYEKILPGIWSKNGFFELVDAWVESDGIRNVYKFKLLLTQEKDVPLKLVAENEPNRIIPTVVKLEVWKRDGGKCVICGQNTDLHFDHIIPYSRGGTSLSSKNIQLLCARHNLEKRDKIE